jgi:UDP-3-O-[3-hydroxymyristoyl] N-acetylglucosamine deacetylase
LSGIALHSGEISTMTVHPAPANTGIVFKRIDLVVPNHQKIIECSIDNIVNSQLCTSLENMYGHKVNMTEHLLSAFHGLSIDNAIIDLNASELPILDGSSKEIVETIECVGIKELSIPKKVIKILKPFMVGDENSYIKVQPNDKLSIDYTIVYNHSLIKRQNFRLDELNEYNYKEMISSSRTFGFEDDIDTLRKKGLIKGGSTKNAIVLSKDGILNDENLRFKDEFVRHKILDAIGDIFIIGNPIIGHIEAYCAGHRMMHEMLFAMLADSSLWAFDTPQEQSDTCSHYNNQEILNYI